MFRGVISIFTLAVFILAACKNSDRQDKETPTDSLANNNTGKDTTAPGDPSFDSNFSVRVLTVGTFHHDEVEANASSLDWVGLFSNKGAYYLKQTEIIATRIHDPVLDEANERTGWQVKTNNLDSCLLLIEPLSFLTDRTVQNVKLSQKSILPGDSLSFTFSGYDYKLF